MFGELRCGRPGGRGGGRAAAAPQEIQLEGDLAGRLARVWGPDVLRCVRCGGEVALLAFVTDPPVARAILAHVGLPTEPPRVASARGPPPDDGDFAQDTRGWELDFDQDSGQDAPA